MSSENPLSSQDILMRRNNTIKVAEHTCQYSPWSRKISQVVLFGSLALNEGYPDSDADLSFFTNEITIPGIDEYKEQSISLLRTVNKCREIYKVTFLINPFLVFESWLEDGGKPYLIPEVIEDIKYNRSVPIWKR